MLITIDKVEYEATLAQKDSQIAALRHELDQLKRMIFGAKSEKFRPNEVPSEQLGFDFSDYRKPARPGEAGRGSKAESEAEAATEQITYQRKKKRKPHPGRTPFPDHLPVERIVLEPEEDTEGMVKIGEDVTRKVDYTPGSLKVVEYVRPRYARPEAEQTDAVCAIVQAAVPDQVLPKSIPGAGLLAHIVVAKYIDHLPFYRQIKMIERDHGWKIHQSTLGDWFAATCSLLEPLYQALLANVLQTDYLQGDESRLTVLQSGNDEAKKKSEKLKAGKKSHLGYMWVFRNPLNGNVLFTYRPGRGANVLHETLGDFSGYLQSDGYSAYSSYLKKHAQSVKLVSCLAHIRRKFFDAQKNHPQLAREALLAIQYLYRIEAICRKYDCSYERRRAIRQRYARPAYEALLEWVEYHQRNNLSKGAIGKALLYAKNHLPRLRHYIEDGRIEIDNNQIENKIRPLALGRKNYLFAGSNKAAQRAAMMYSFFASCQANGINPHQWLQDVLLRIGNHKINRIEELLPDQWYTSQTGKM